MKNTDLNLKIFCFLLFVITYNLSFSASVCSEYLNSEDSIIFEHTNTLEFPKTEVFRKNNNMGPQQYGSLKLVKWFEFSSDFSQNTNTMNVVGLTKEGDIFHVIKFEKRSIARRLNGLRTYSDISANKHSQILALSKTGQTYIYSPKKWNIAAKQEAINTWLKLWAAGSLVTVAAKYFIVGDLGVPASFLGLDFNFPFLESFFIMTTGMSSGFAALSKYESLNTYPDGFVAINIPFKNRNWEKEALVKELTEGSKDEFKAPPENILAPRLAEELTEDIY